MKILLISALLALTFSTTQANEQMKADAEAVNSACTQDGATAGCGNEKVGSGLLKCLHAYKKAHKEFKFQESCVTAMKTMRADRKAHKAEKTK